VPFARPYVKFNATPFVTASPWKVGNMLRGPYNCPQGTLPGRDGAICVMSLGGGLSEADIKDSWALTGIDVAAPAILGGLGDYTGQGADVENLLDVIMSAAAYSVATGKRATVHMLYLPNTYGSFATAAQQAQSLGLYRLSMSWGADESAWGPANADSVDAAFGTFIAYGGTISAAAGDNSSDDGGGTTGVDFPGSSPNVWTGGGTKLFHDPATEKVWGTANADGQGTGCGASAFFGRPTWQVGSGLPGGGRWLPDGSMDAAPATGYELVIGGQRGTVGGTSAVAPMFAGFFEALGAPLGNPAPLLWGHPTAFAPVAKGESGIWAAPWACGLGAPDLTAIAKLMG
jgi:kumamolisin